MIKLFHGTMVKISNSNNQKIHAMLISIMIKKLVIIFKIKFHKQILISLIKTGQALPSIETPKQNIRFILVQKEEQATTENNSEGKNIILPSNLF